MNRNGPELEKSRLHSPTDRTERWPKRVWCWKYDLRSYSVQHSLHRPGLIQNNLARENLIPLVFFVISFRISKSCIFVVVLSNDLKPLNSKCRTVNSVVEIHRNALCKSEAAIFAFYSNPHPLNIYIRFLWVSILAPTYSLPLLFEYLFILPQRVAQKPIR